MIFGRDTEGVADQVKGTAQNLYGRARESSGTVINSFEKMLRNTVETQPYTAAAIALGLGWLLGRMHQPL